MPTIVAEDTKSDRLRDVHWIKKKRKLKGGRIPPPKKIISGICSRGLVAATDLRLVHFYKCRPVTSVHGRQMHSFLCHKAPCRTECLENTPAVGQPSSSFANWASSGWWSILVTQLWSCYISSCSQIIGHRVMKQLPIDAGRR